MSFRCASSRLSMIRSLQHVQLSTSCLVHGLRLVQQPFFSSGCCESNKYINCNSIGTFRMKVPTIAAVRRHLSTDCIHSSCKGLIEKLGDNLVVLNNFVTVDEEQKIMEEITPYMERLRYEYDHWDDAIHGYRETERREWNASNQVVIKRIRDTVFPTNDNQQAMSLVHVLDLEAEGVIKPHVDSVRFCGDTIAGVSLLSDSVMRLVSTKDTSLQLDLLLKRRSLYIMRHRARYDFTHEILSNKESLYRGEPIEKGRRVSIICRNEPVS